MRSAKGSRFERALCKRLSLWWTSGERDDVFWRSSQSGGRATTRRKAGKSTFGSYGDIAAVDPIGRPLLDKITLELKRGYSKTSFSEVFDRTNKTLQGTFESFLEQAITQAQEAKTEWMLITQRDQHHALCFYPWTLEAWLLARPADLRRTRRYIRMKCPVRYADRTFHDVEMCVCTLDHWLHAVSPGHFTY
jgi:hypothetical protein